jgi:ABC-2 type transport system permease protein
MNMVGKTRSGKYIKFCAYLAVIVLMNIVGVTLFFRLDLTSDKIYSISKASREAVSGLSEPLTIQVFFTKDLPAPYNTTERYLHDLLQEYGLYANSYFNYRFYDVSADEGEISDQTSENQRLANNYGIHPIQIQAIEKDEVKFQRAYMGLVVLHGDLIERIPMITTTAGLEYKLTTAIQKLNNKISALLALPGKIQVKLFLSPSIRDLAPYIGLKNLSEIPEKLQAIVKKLNQQNYGKLSFESASPSEEKEIDEVSEKYKIMTLKWPAIPQGKIPPGRGVIGLVTAFGSKILTIPLLQEIRLPLIGTQYKLMDTSEIEDRINENVAALINVNQDLGFLAGNGTLTLPGASPFDRSIRQNQDDLSNLRSLVAQNYTIKTVDLKDGPIPEGLNCLAIVRPTENFSDYELFQIDQFLMKGKSLFLILDRFQEVEPANQQGMNLGNRGPIYRPLDTGLEKLLEHYGIRIKKSYAMDENCYRQEMPAALGGGDRPIYFAPVIKNQFINKNLKFMKNIKSLVALKISPLELIPERISQNGLKAYKLFASSDKSWEMSGQINLNPIFIQPPASADRFHSLELAYLLEGEFPSYFAGKPIPVKEIRESEPDKESDSKKSVGNEKQKPPEGGAGIDASKIQQQGQFLEKGRPGKIFLMASADMLKDNVLDAGGRGSNTIFILNVVDYLNGREDIAAMRSKEQSFNPLNDTPAATKTILKAFNIVGLPILVVLFGLGVWWRRHSRKKQIRLIFKR